MIPDRTDSQDSQVQQVVEDALPAAGEGVKTGTREQRERLRSEFFRGRKLWIEYRGQVLAAKVVDSSDHGLGVETPAPLEVNSFVWFAGVGLRGRAQVKHCRRSDDGVFRAGLNLETVSFRELDDFSRVLPQRNRPGA